MWLLFYVSFLALLNSSKVSSSSGLRGIFGDGQFDNMVDEEVNQYKISFHKHLKALNTF